MGGRLEGRIALVTGASRGIGHGTARRLADEGAEVILTARGAADLDAATSAIRSTGGRALSVAGDAGSTADVDALFDMIRKRYGRIDIVVNNAAWSAPVAHFLELDETHWDTVIRSNLKSVYLHCHRAANLMADTGTRGTIVNISSFAAARSHRQMAAYDASKGGMEALSRTMAIDLAPFGIRVNVVGPGAIHTEEFAREGEEAMRRRAQTVPLGRVGLPEDIAAAVAFLVSDDASYISGQILYVDGGVLAQLRSPQVDIPLPESVQRRLNL